MMKRLAFFLLIVATFATTFYSCKTNTDDLWDSIHQLDGRVTSLEDLCKQMNGNISSLQKLVQALQDNNSITKVTPIKEGEKVTGYTISFLKGEPITIYHGEKGDKGEQGDKGNDGTTPVITVDQDGETYYWKVNGEWLTDKKGNKIPTTGEDGQDAVSPQLEIRNGRWFLFNGETWTDMGQATGDAGKDGDSVFESVEEKEGYVEFTLPSGTVLTIPKNTLSIVNGIKSVSYIPRYDDGKATVVGTSKADSYIELDFEISPKESADLLVEYDGVVSVQGVYTSIRTRAVDFIQFPVLAVSAENGILSLKVSGENLDDIFFAGTQGVQVALKLEDSESTYISDYIGVVPSLPVYTFTATYKTTYSNQTIKIANDIDAYPIAGAGNRLIGIDYGDGTSGVSSTHTYATQGEHTVTFSFVNDVTEIGEHAFENCSQLTDIAYPKNITKISDFAFHKTGLVNIIIPNTVTYIGVSAFEYCVNVEYINIPNSIQILSSRAFAFCDKLRNFELVSTNNDRNIIGIRDGVLYSNDGDDVTIIRYPPKLEGKSYNILLGYTAIAGSAFRTCNNLQNISFSTLVHHIGESAFRDCKNLSSIEGLSSTKVTTLGWCVFSGCGNLVSIGLPITVEEIEDGAFQGCTSLTGDLVIPDNVKTIGANAYEGCAGFKGKLIIPNSVETIGDRAFGGCTGVLKGGELYLGTGLKQIGERAFDAGSDDNVSIPSSFSKIYCNATIPPIIDYSELGCEQLIVPKGYLEVYQNSNWASVSNYITEEN